VIGRGRLIIESSTEDVIARSTDKSVRVRTPEAERLARLIEAAGGTAAAGDKTAAAGTAVFGGPPVLAASGSADARAPAAANGAGLLTVTGLDAARIGELAASAQIVLHELTPLASLEEAFMELTSGSLEFGRHEPDPSGARSQPDPVDVSNEPDPVDGSAR